jgi:hypothetical protein
MKNKELSRHQYGTLHALVGGRMPLARLKMLHQSHLGSLLQRKLVRGWKDADDNLWAELTDLGETLEADYRKAVPLDRIHSEDELTARVQRLLRVAASRKLAVAS